MPPLLRFVIYRLLAVPLTLLIITLALYGFVMLAPPEVRATLYYPSGLNTDKMTDAEIQEYNQLIIRRFHLDAPFPVQYGLWASNLIRGDWGYSPVRREKVLPALLRRSPVTAELAFYSILFFIPFGLYSGVKAGSRKDSLADNRFRLSAFVAVSLPPFVMALVLLSIFYVGLHWFPPQRLGLQSTLFIHSDAFRTFTGFLTIDGFLNNRPDISLEAFKHLVLPMLTIGLGYWGILGRITRVSVIEETYKEHVIAARARGIAQKSLVWKHIFRNALTPALTSSALSAAALFTSIFIVEQLFDRKGVSSLVLDFNMATPDAPILLGFAVYSVIVVLILMLILDLIVAILDPRVREGVLSG